MNELLETERAYVEELLCVLQVFISTPQKLYYSLSFTCASNVMCCFCVLQGYASEMDNPAMASLIPAPLQNKKEVLFGNMPEIYHFHKR